MCPRRPSDDQPTRPAGAGNIRAGEDRSGPAGSARRTVVPFESLGRLLPSLPTEQFAYELPPELIAQEPATPRDSSRLLVVDRATGRFTHARFSEIGRWLRAGDLLVVNRSRVVPARLAARRRPGGGAAEILLLKRVGPGRWEALVKPGRKLEPGSVVDLGSGIVGEVVERSAAGGRLIQFSLETKAAPPGDVDAAAPGDVDAAAPGDVDAAAPGDVDAAVLALGSLPLPPYIHGYTGDPERYQTVYGDQLGSAAAPTAGLHFTPPLLESLAAQGVGLATVTLHVGLDTFRPVKVDDLAQHEIHRETCTLPTETAEAISETRARGGRVVAVGTTTVRTLETAGAASEDGQLAAWTGDTGLFIVPGYRFRVVDAMVTNFHLPRSTLLALVSAFAGRDLIMAAYAEAIRERYRFFSFGDATLLL
ncbi:MAG: tRNA preQ1(34) S-adenosylmethionine ribosyltransferase-isomerase QueA [Chloroflexi bacterium]|nr:tRNA preQ1(34) S-adenosylmethionine ribosyltransferase-isomerase QueA [Chloroflexota bacterium]